MRCPNYRTTENRPWMIVLDISEDDNSSDNNLPRTDEVNVSFVSQC